MDSELNTASRVKAHKNNGKEVDKLGIPEVQAKQTTLEAQLAELVALVPTLQFGTEEYNAKAEEYLSVRKSLANMPAELAAAQKEANASEINAASAAVAEAITKLVEGLKVAELLGEPVTGLRYFNVASKDDAGVETMSAGVVFNPLTKVPSTRAPKDGGEATGTRQAVVTASGEKMSKTAFVKACTTLTAEEQAEKYPHALVASGPKFEAFLKAHPELAGAKLE